MVDNEILISSDEESDSSDESDTEQEKSSCMCIDEDSQKCIKDKNSGVESVTQNGVLIQQEPTSKPLIEDMTEENMSSLTDVLNTKDSNALFVSTPAAASRPISHVNEEDMITKL